MEEKENNRATDKARRQPDGTTTVRIGKTNYIVSVFFNHDTDKTFVDKVKQVIKRKQG